MPIQMGHAARTNGPVAVLRRMADYALKHSSSQP